jgi:PAS domain S-box-containing protein
MNKLTADRPVPPEAQALSPALERLFSVSWTLTVNVVNAAIVVMILWGALPAAMLLGWLVTMAVVVAARLALSYRFNRTPEARPVESWARLHALGSGATGLNWGLTGFVPLLVDDAFAHVLVVMTAAGMGAGALILSFVHLPSFRAFVLCHSLPVVAGVALHGGATYQAIAAMGLVFILVLDRIGAGFNHNFLEMQALQRRLVASEQRMRDFAEAASHWLWETDRDGRFTMMSDGIERLTGRPARSFIGRRPGEILGTPPPAEIERCMAKGEPFMDQLSAIALDDGRRLTLAVSGKPVYDEAAKLIGFRGITRDVTAQREAELTAEDMRRARDVAATADQLKTRFLASVSHELRTPLNAVLGFSEMMEREMLGPLGTPAYKGYAHDIHVSGQHLLELINDLLDMSRIELGHYRLADTVTGVRQIVESSAGIVRAATAGSGIEIRTDGVDMTLVVRADQRAMRQVMINLLSNAARAAPKGSSVEVAAAYESAGGIVITVRDHGTGIPPNQIENLFQPFNSSAPERVRRDGGTGLGLWISRTLVELHGGTLTLASDGVHGTTAIVRLPADRIAAV